MAKKKIGKHLQFYMDCMNRDSLKGFGLCYCARHGYIDENILQIMEPTPNDDKALQEEGYDTMYWASGEKDSLIFNFTPLRQTIVLFMAAINNEL